MNSQKYDEEREFIEASAAVYAWISSADGQITRSEVNAFVEFLGQSSFVKSISDEDFSEIYLTILNAFAENFEDGRARAEARIEPLRTDPNKSKELIRIARKALVADSVLMEPEELVISDICQLLGISEENVD